MRTDSVLIASIITAVTVLPLVALGAEPGLIQELRRAGAAIRALGEEGGLAGYLVKPAEEEPYSLYMTEDGHAVLGILYDPNGELLTEGQIAASLAGKKGAATLAPVQAALPSAARADVAATASPTTSCSAGANDKLHGTPGLVQAQPAVDNNPKQESLFEQTSDAFGFTIGERGPTIHLFADPNCPWSRRSVASLAQKALEGNLRVHVIPVGILGQGSEARAVGIASSPDPIQAWFEDTTLSASPEGAQRIAANNALREAWPPGGVPFKAYRDPSGGVAHHLGYVADAHAWLSTLGAGQ